ncbi:MAG TPA: trigger factor [candidate division Zixibacteria bacterium]|nr:trigger factor [candidate division Zixibacteria bacterium]
MNESKTPAEISAEITSESGLKRTITVEAPASEVDAAFDQEYRKIQRSVTLKGFRKGRAPLSRIKALYGGDVTSDVIDRLFSTTYSRAISKLELNVAAPPRISDVTLQEGEPFRFVAEVEVFPQVAAVDLTGLIYTETPTEVVDKDVDDVIENVRRQRSPLEDVDRAVEATDVVTADMNKTKDEGNVIDGDHFPDSVIDLSNENTVRELRDGLVGARVGETRSITVSYPEDYPDKPFAGQSISYDVTVKQAQVRKLLEINDAFAKEQAGADSLEALRQRIRDGIAQERESLSRRNRTNQLISQVVAKNPLDVPDALVNRYVDDMVADYRKNSPPDEQIHEEELRNRYRLVGANQLRWKLLSDKLIEQEKIEVSEADTDNWIKEFAAGNNLDPAAARNALASGGRMERVRDSILEGKVIDLLVSRATRKEA